MKKWFPYIAIGLIAVVVLGFGKKLLQAIGLMDDDATALAKNQQKEVVKAIVNMSPDERQLQHPLAYYTTLAEACYHLCNDFFTYGYSDTVLKEVPQLNVAELQQLCKAFAQFSADKSLWQSINEKFGGWLENITGANNYLTLFSDALGRANLKV